MLIPIYYFFLFPRRLFFLLSLLFLTTLTLSGCHSYHVEATVVNNTGHPLELLEVQYPSASFGANHMEPGETLHYRFQILGQGTLKVHYFTGLGHQVETTIDGPNSTNSSKVPSKSSSSPTAKPNSYLNSTLNPPQLQ